MVKPAMMAPVNPRHPVTPQIQVGIKNMGTRNMFYFGVNVVLKALFVPNAALDCTDSINAWKLIVNLKKLYATHFVLFKYTENVVTGE